MTHFSPVTVLEANASLLRPTPAAATRRYAFLLIGGFTHLALAAAIEPLRLANIAARRQGYGWRLLSESGGSVEGSGGIRVQVDGALADLERDEMLIIVAGDDVRQRLTESLVARIRRLSVRGAAMGSLCGGVQLLARAGVLAGQECAVHWEHAEAMEEEYPDLEITCTAFEASRVPTAPGGIAAADLMLHQIGADLGPVTAAKVADQMLLGQVRGPGAAQTVSHQARYGVRNARLARVLRCMEENLEVPLTALEIADIAALSVRQTERLFRRHLNMTPMAFYGQMRLDRAHGLLTRTEMSLMQIAVACGFQSASHFAKKYRSHFGVNPSKTRAGLHAVPPRAAIPAPVAARYAA
ncbi:GlxA family transcriptional regulator [Phaeovulum sp. W22_SRMD_FR3]|uniref:GlxA family transcriptional regulator n=1 Tax=Phaeovulum sp. W22_SRMD_FR3 TaxID=3240274 RepID=UPI003F9AF75F